jgi:hypothetical protein
VGKPEGRWIILKFTLEKLDGVIWTELIWLRIGDLWKTLVNMVVKFWVP